MWLLNGPTGHFPFRRPSLLVPSPVLFRRTNRTNIHSAGQGCTQIHRLQRHEECTCPTQLVQYGADGSEATGTHFIEGDRVARRWPALGDQPSRAIPSKARGAPASRHASTSKHGPAVRKSDSKSSFPANALLTSPSRRVVAIEATRSGSISHRVMMTILSEPEHFVW